MSSSILLFFLLQNQLENEKTQRNIVVTMSALPELIIQISTIIGVIAAVILVLIILISKRLTATHVYIMEVALLYVVLQIVSPFFHHIYMDGEFPQPDNLTLSAMCCVVIVGIVTLLMLLFLMDYFRCIRENKFLVMALHAAFLLCIGLVNLFVVNNYRLLEYVSMPMVFFALFVFAFIFLLHRDVECLKKRQQTDEESRLRYLLILVFFTVNVSATLLLILGNFLRYTFRYYWLEHCSLGLAQMHPVFFVIVTFTVDRKLRINFLDFFKMCSSGRSDKVQFSNLPADNGRLVNQNV